MAKNPKDDFFSKVETSEHACSVASDQSNIAATGSSSTQPHAPPRTKRGLTKVSKSATPNKMNSASSAGKSFFQIGTLHRLGLFARKTPALN